MMFYWSLHQSLTGGVRLVMFYWSLHQCLIGDPFHIKMAVFALIITVVMINKNVQTLFIDFIPLT